MDWKEWGSRLRAHMKEAGVTQEALAEKMGVTQGAIAHWLKGRREINLAVFFELCAKAGADPQRILFAVPSVGDLAGLRKFFAENPWVRELSARALDMDDAMNQPLPSRRQGRGKPVKNAS